jgi:twitching motility protein PilT
MSLTLPALLKVMTDKNASDLHITAGSPPRLRIDGVLVQLQADPLTPVDAMQLCYSVMDDAQKQRFEQELELDFSFGIRGMARFRASVYTQQTCVAGAFRLVPYQIPSLEELGLPPIVAELCDRRRGLVLVTGPAGAGKSTTLASMIDRINTNVKGHIVTLEDPIEFQHQHRRCLVNQREIGRDSASLQRALAHVARQDPDVVLIGELRDPETIEAALAIAETGHLVLGTLPTPSAVESIHRLVEVLPPHAQGRARGVLSHVLGGVIAQVLLPKAAGPGRALAAEVLVPSAAVRNLIREDKLHQVHSQMQIGQPKGGMQTLNQALAELCLGGAIALETALGASSDPDELRTMIQAVRGALGDAAPPQDPEPR